MTSILLVWSMLLLTTVVHVLGFILFSRLWRIPIKGIGLFFGPPVRSRTWKGIQFTLNAVPLPSGYVTFVGGDQEECPQPGTFLALPVLVQALINLSGPIASLGLAALLIGPTRADAEFRSGFLQIFSGMFSLTRARELLGAIDAFARTAPWWTLLGIAAAKSTALNALPVPNFNGGNAILALIRGRKPMPPWMIKIQWFGFLFLLLFVGMTVIALISLRVSPLRPGP